MARLNVRHIVSKAERRHYWQPSAELRRRGWRTVRLPESLAAAIHAAERLNRLLDAARGDRADLARIVAALRHEPAAFAEARQAAPHLFAGSGDRVKLADDAAPARGSVADLIHAWRASQHWLEDIKPDTRRFYDARLKRLLAVFGDLPAGAVSPQDVHVFYDTRRALHHVDAVHCVRTGQALYAWGILNADRGRFPDLPEHRGLNPFAGQKLRGIRSQARLWAPDDVDAVIAAADVAGMPSIGTIVALGYGLGQRPRDLIAMPRAAWNGHGFHFRQSKTGEELDIPASSALFARVREELARQSSRKLAGTALVLAESTGRPWEYSNFSHRFADVRAAAAIGRPDVAGLKLMWLRHTVVVRLANAGVGTIGIAAITGHTLKSVDSILETYNIRRAAQARAAVAQLLAHEETVR